MIMVTARRMNPPRAFSSSSCFLPMSRSDAAPKVKIRTQADKTFSFKNLRTWDWHADGAGEVKLMTTQMDMERSEASARDARSNHHGGGRKGAVGPGVRTEARRRRFHRQLLRLDRARHVGQRDGSIPAERRPSTDSADSQATTYSVRSSAARWCWM